MAGSAPYVMIRPASMPLPAIDDMRWDTKEDMETVGKKESLGHNEANMYYLEETNDRIVGL